MASGAGQTRLGWRQPTEEKRNSRGLTRSIPAHSQGIDTFEALFATAPLVPILVLANRESEDIAWQATQRARRIIS